MSGYLIETVSRTAQRVGSDQGVEVYHLEMSGRILRVLIDAPGGVSLDACARFSRALSEGLDRLDIVGGRYVLEVSSPGIERHLYRPEDYVAAAGSNVQVRSRAGVLEGTLVRADERGITLSVVREETPVETIVGYNEIRSGRVRIADAELFSKPKEPKVSR